MLKILVTFALRQEGISFERRLTRAKMESGLVLGDLNSREVAVYYLGTGLRNEIRFATILSDLRFDLVINSGFAGAVRTLLEPGDFVLSENFGSPEWLDRIKATGIFEASGQFVSVEAIADPEAKRRIASEGDVLALDMESARLAAVCRRISLPWLSARMISDRFDEGIPGIFLGRGIKRTRELSEAIAFASRMIVLRRRLADRLTELIEAIGEEGEEPQISPITQI